MGQPKKINKQRLRARISNAASYTEIYISAVVLVGIIILSLGVIFDIKDIIVTLIHGEELPEMHNYLSTALELIIGIEFIKMLAKHTPSSAVEVLLYAIARKIIGEQGEMFDVLIGVVAIVILFFIRKYLSATSYQSDHNEFVVNGGVTINEVNGMVGGELSKEHGNTAAGIIANIAKENGETLEPGYEVVVDGMIFQVYSMDSNLIKQVKVVYDDSNVVERKLKALKNRF